MSIPKEFRAWDKEHNEYIDHESLCCASFSLGEILACYELEQFTGAYDSTTWQELTEDERAEWTRRGNMPSEWKGRKIFENDRVSFDGNITADNSIGIDPNGYMYDETDVYTVVWDKNLLAWNLDFEDDEEMKYKRDTRALLLAGRCKVIGHIHEVTK